MQRRFLPIVAVLTIWSLWATGVVGLDLFDKLREGLVMTFTMVFASFVAGATSEGGGAIAFPIMTLILDIEPSIARDFALMIQSVGMGMATFFIVVKGIKVDWQTIGWGLFALWSASGTLCHRTDALSGDDQALLRLNLDELWDYPLEPT